MAEAQSTVIFSGGRSARIKGPGAKVADKLISVAEPSRVAELRERGVYKLDMWVQEVSSGDSNWEQLPDGRWNKRADTIKEGFCVAGGRAHVNYVSNKSDSVSPHSLPLRKGV